MHTIDSPPRWRRCPEERPAQILEAALAEFGEKGLSGARISDIAKRAGVSKGTIYLYFPTKDDLFREVIRTTVGETVAALSTATHGGTAEQKLRDLIPVLWDRLRTPEFDTVYRLIYGELHQFPDLIRFYSEEVAGQITRIISEVVQEGIEADDFRMMNPDVAARIVAALFVKHALWSRRREYFSYLSNETDAEVLDELTSFIFHALRP